MIQDILSEINAPKSLTSLTEEVAVAQMPDLSLDSSSNGKKDIFALDKRKSWDKSVEARCDFSFHLRLTCRASVYFTTIWQKTVFGRTLTDIKSDDDMVPFFASSLAPVINKALGNHLDKGNWALVTTPMRRHTERNFASHFSAALADMLHVPFYYDCAHCRSKQRIGAVFDPNNIPNERNIIVVDDFVTTGSTLLSMRNLLTSLGKNVVFFAGVNNKL